MKNRSELREVAMKCLYQVYIMQPTKLEYDIKSIIHEQLEVENDFVNMLVFGVIEKEKEIDELADKYLVDWKIPNLWKFYSYSISINYNFIQMLFMVRKQDLYQMVERLENLLHKMLVT